MKDPNGVKIQVDSAIRDGNGAKIDTHYATKTELQGKQDIYQNKGSATQGVYTDANGQIQPMTYSLGMSVPAGSKLTDTTYSAGDGLVLTGTVFTPNTSFVSSGKNYKVSVDSTTKGLFVNVPWTDTVTTANTSGTGNAVTSITASNGQLTIKKDTTFLTAHQTVTDNAPTLAWDTTSTVATIGNTPITVKMPPNPDTNTTYSQASGGGLTLSGTQFSVNTGYTTSGKNYKVQVDQSTGGLYVNVPWSSYSAGDGLVLTGTVFTPNTSYVSTGKNYKVTVDPTTKGLFVYVPWENTTYSNGSGLNLSNGTFSVNTSYTTSGKNYAVKVDQTSGGLYVNVPWSDTTYTAGDGLVLTGSVFTPNTSYVTSGKNYKVAVDSTTKGLYVNVPWENTVTTIASTTGSGNAVTQISASNGQLTVTKGTTFATASQLQEKQDALVSGTNIKTINNQSILGSGDISVSANISVSTTGSGNAVTQVSANQSQLTVTKGITFSTSETTIAAGAGFYEIDTSSTPGAVPSGYSEEVWNFTLVDGTVVYKTVLVKNSS